MYTRWLWGLALVLAISGMMWQLGGFGDLFPGQAPGDQIDSADQLRDTANNSALDRNFTGDASPNNGELVGLALSAVGAFSDMIGFVVYLPGQLLALGLPNWAARPLGVVAVIFGSISLIQIASNRIWS